MAWEHRAHILHLSVDCERDILFKNNVQAIVTLLALKKASVFALFHFLLRVCDSQKATLR